MSALLLAGADERDVDRRADGTGRYGTDDVLPVEYAIGCHSEYPVAFAKAGFLRGRAADDVPDPHSLPGLVGVHGHPQPGPPFGGLRRGVGRNEDAGARDALRR